MAARLLRSLRPREFQSLLTRSLLRVIAVFILFPASAIFSQNLIRPSEPGEVVTLLPSDMATLEADETRRDLPCTVTARKAEMGFDLRFHSVYDVILPLRELEGNENTLTVLFRVYRSDDKDHPKYFTQHFRVPLIEADAKGEAALQGAVDVGEGQYHVDWLMRDREERICSSRWDVDATIPLKDRPMSLFIKAGEIAPSVEQPFLDVPRVSREPGAEDPGLTVKLLLNFAPQDKDSAALQRTDTDALLSILKEIELDPHISHISLVAFNMQERRVVYRQESAPAIDLPKLGKALQSLKLGTVNVTNLSQKNGETDFLEDLISKEVGDAKRPDAVIFAGPKAMLNADVPRDDLRRIGDIDCPVFYMNYNPNPQAVPWKDSISHAIRAFKGTEYTISRPRDVWFTTTEMVTRIVRAKRQRVISAVVTSAGSQ